MAFGLESNRGKLTTHSSRISLAVFLGAVNDISPYFSLLACLTLYYFSLYVYPCLAHCLSVAAQKRAVDEKGIPVQSEQNN